MILICMGSVRYPVYSFFLPIYSFWCMDEFSWGNTRVVICEGKDKKVITNEDGKFDGSIIPLKFSGMYSFSSWKLVSVSDCCSLQNTKLRHGKLLRVTRMQLDMRVNSNRGQMRLDFAPNRLTRTTKLRSRVTITATRTLPTTIALIPTFVCAAVSNRAVIFCTRTICCNPLCRNSTRHSYRSCPNTLNRR